MIWEQLMNSVGLGVFHVDETNANDEDMSFEQPSDPQQQQQVVRCRQM